MNGKSQVVVEIAVPRHRALFFVVGIDDDLHRDSMFARGVSFGFGHDEVDIEIARRVIRRRCVAGD